MALVVWLSLLGLVTANSNPELEPGVWIERLKFVDNTRTGSCTPNQVDGHAPYWAFKQRFGDPVNFPQAQLNPQGYYARMMGFFEWNESEANISGIALNESCGNGVLQLGTINRTAPLMMVPFILDSLPTDHACGLKINGTSLIPGNDAISLTTWRRKQLNFSAEFMGYNHIMNLFCPHGNESNDCPGASPSFRNLSICEHFLVQCLHIPNITAFDVTDPALLWGLSAPGLGLPSSPAAVDLLLGPPTHFALMITPEAISSLGPNVTLDLSTMNNLALLAVPAMDRNLSIRVNESLLAYYGLGQNTLELPANTNLRFYAGQFVNGSVNLPQIQVLQFYNPAFRYYFDHTTLPSSQMADLSCANMFQAQYSNLSQVCGSLTAAGGCALSQSFCFGSAPSLEHLAFRGYAVDFTECLPEMPKLKTLLIEGSPMKTLPELNISSLTKIQLSHNPRLESLPDLDSNITVLAITGNQRLPKLNLSAMASLVDLSLSFAHTLDFSMIPRQLKRLTCDSCSLASLPDLTDFLELEVLAFPHNQLSYSITEFLNLPWFPLPRLYQVDMTANAIGGAFPDKPDYFRLMLPGRGGPVKFVLDHNQIESFNNQQPFPDGFFNFSNTANLIQTVPWLSLRNNRLARIDFSLISSRKINLDLNFAATPLEVVQTAFVYGVQPTPVLASQLTNKRVFGLPKREIQSVMLMLMITSNATAASCTSGTFAGAGATVSTTANIVNVTVQGISFGSIDCLEETIMNISKPDQTRLLSCVAQLPLILNCLTNFTLMFTVRLFDVCSSGRGFSESTNQCEACPVNSYSAVWATSITPQMDVPYLDLGCTTCPVFNEGGQSVTLEASRTLVDQCVCPLGTYGLPATHNANTSTDNINCQVCDPTAMSCVVPNLTVPAAQPGFYYNEGDGHFLLCDPSVACINGRCQTGYVETATNMACSGCADGYYRINRQCQKCNGASEVVLVFVTLFLLLALLASLRLGRHGYAKISTLTITIGYIQIISIFANFPVYWPPVTHNLLNFLSFFNFNFDLASPECAVQTTYWSKWTMKLLLPLIALGVLFLWYLLVRHVPKIQSLYLRFVTKDGSLTCVDKLVAYALVGKGAKQLLASKATAFAEEQPNHDVYQANLQWEKEHLSSRFVSVAVTLASVGFTFAVKTTTQPFNCLRTVINGEDQYHLRADSSVPCYDTTWYSFLPLSILGMLVYCIGIPLAFFLILMQGKRRSSLSDPNFFAMFGALCLPFRQQFWYWELVQLARKLTTVLCIDFFAGNTTTSTFAQINSVLVVLVLFLVLQEYVRPYDFTWCNRLEFTWTAMSLTVLVAALVFSMNSLSEAQSNAYSVFLVLVLVAALMVSVYCLLMEKRRSFVKNTLYMSRMDRIQQEHKLMGDAFGHDVGENLYRKTRNMNPQYREQFLERLAGLLGEPKEGEIGLTELSPLGEERTRKVESHPAEVEE